MSQFEIIDDQYLMPTPAGAFHAVASNGNDLARELIFRILDYSQSPVFKIEQVRKWIKTQTDEQALGLIYHMQTTGLIQGLSTPQHLPHGSLEEVLPDLIQQLSFDNKALLADSQGFYIANHGYTHEAAEELSALSADIGSMHKRHAGLLNHNLKLQSSAWAIVDASGNSQIGFWPLYIGEQRFVLAINGLPQFNQQAFIHMTWVLSKRYAQDMTRQAVGED